MKKIPTRAIIAIAAMAALFFGSCKKGGDGSTPGGQTPQPTVNAPSVSIYYSTNGLGDNSLVTGHDAIASGGEVSADGGSPVTARGVCWSTSPNPTVADNKTSDGSGKGKFASKIGGLNVNTKYYLRAYATNSAGTAYSLPITLTTAYLIGEKFGGGIVVYIDPTTLHGLIAAESVIATEAWGTGTAGAYSTTDGAGNTNKIVNTFGAGAKNAATACRACRDGGYSDWFLPATSQLTILGIPSFGATYWSSTESSTNVSWATVTTQPYGNAYGGEPKSAKHEVRPMRAF